jgi:hypothetical protein
MWATAQNLFPHFGPWHRIRTVPGCGGHGAESITGVRTQCGIGIPAMGHYVKYGSQWLVGILVPCCRPPCGIWGSTVGHSAESVSPLWITAQNLVPAMDQGAKSASLLSARRRIWFPAMARGAESDSLLWATAQNLIPSFGPRRRIRLPPVGQSAQNLVPHFGSQRRIWFLPWTRALNLATSLSARRRICFPVMGYGPRRRIRFSPVGTAQNLIPSFGPWRRIRLPPVGQSAQNLVPRSGRRRRS